MNRSLTLLSVGLLATCARAQSSGDIPDYHRKLRRVQAGLRVFGATACTNCHSGGRAGPPGAKSGVAADLWRGPDFDGPHYTAYKTLFSDRSKVMARRLAAADGSNPEPTKRDDCLSCHAFGHDIPKNMKQTAFQLDDGVSCEACHGRSERWQAPHQFKKDWRAKSAAQWLEAGMYDTRDLRRWAEKCLECHLAAAAAGAADPQDHIRNRVTHTLMGAGHPPLTFELAADTFGVPKHWDDTGTYLDDSEGSWYFARLWAVGQAVTLRETMTQLRAWSGRSRAAPDFALFDCYACHHEFLKTPSRSAALRIVSSVGRDGGTASASDAPRRVPGLQSVGQPSCNAAPWIVARHLVAQFLPDEDDALGSAIDAVVRSLRLQNPDADAVGAAARAVEGIADRLAGRLAGARFDRDMARSVLRRIVADHRRILAAGPLGADQAFGALNALYYLAWADSPDKPDNDAGIMDAINRLRPLIYDDRGALDLKRFDPDAFRKIMTDLSDLFAAPG